MFIKFLYFLFFIIFALERLFSTFLKKKEPEGEIKYKNLTRILIIGYTLGMFVPIAEFFIFQKKIASSQVFIGCLLLAIGVSLRKFSINSLGERWSVHNKQIRVKKLIKTGSYQYLRHPYYLSVILELLGLKFYFNSFWALIIILFIQIPILCVRVHLEEKMLLDEFGKEYEDYQRKTIIL
jgi:protein-S-isoprenylcysteine O-methyltransferase Ste14